MATEFISREATIERFCNVYCGCSPDECGFKIPQDGAEECAAVRALQEIHAADVRPVVHGKWTMNSDRPDTLICTACDHAFDVWVWDHKWMHFCPNCGADMREANK